MSDHRAISTGASTAGPQALILEDDAACADVVAAMIATKGWHSHQVSSRQKFIDALGRNRFKLIFLDVFLPDFDAVNAITYLHDSGLTGPVCLITGGPDHILDTVSNLAAARGVEVLAAIRKPFELETLTSVLGHPKFTG